MKYTNIYSFFLGGGCSLGSSFEPLGLQVEPPMALAYVWKEMDNKDAEREIETFVYNHTHK